MMSFESTMPQDLTTLFPKFFRAAGLTSVHGGHFAAVERPEVLLKNVEDLPVDFWRV